MFNGLFCAEPLISKFPATEIFPFTVSVFPPAPSSSRLWNRVLAAVPVPVIVTVLPGGLRVTVLVAPAVKVPLLVNDAPLKVIVLQLVCIYYVYRQAVIFCMNS